MRVNFPSNLFTYFVLLVLNYHGFEFLSLICHLITKKIISP